VIDCYRAVDSGDESAGGKGENFDGIVVIAYKETLLVRGIMSYT
jgi:hypothetical protein